jgi:hypothetical protein
MIVSWFSAGVSSAVATKIANPDRIIYIDIKDQHYDTYRFISDCEKWFDKKIEVFASPLATVEAACMSAGFIRLPRRNPKCTELLKKRVRKEWEYENGIGHTYVWGFDCNEKKRADGVLKAMPNYGHLFPILTKTKQEVHGILEAAGIKRPAMYDMGYGNNNCIGCVAGGMGYWNKIRVDFPEIFKKRCEMERTIQSKGIAGSRILNDCYLDELDPSRGREQQIIMPDCGMFCEIQSASCAQ